MLLWFLIFIFFDIREVRIEEVIRVEREERIIFFVVDSKVEVEPEGSEHGLLVMEEI